VEAWEDLKDRAIGVFCRSRLDASARRDQRIRSADFLDVEKYPR
jgi:hypothetical protein